MIWMTRHASSIVSDEPPTDRSVPQGSITKAPSIAVPPGQQAADECAVMPLTADHVCPQDLDRMAGAALRDQWSGVWRCTRTVSMWLMTSAPSGLINEIRDLATPRPGFDSEIRVSSHS